MVKLKNIFDLSFIIGIFYVSLSSSQSGKLTDEENERRLKNCGKIDIARPSQTNSGVDITFKNQTGRWLSVIGFSNHTHPRSLTAATMISSRHLITSFHVFAQNAAYHNITIDFVGTFCGEPGIYKNVLKEWETPLVFLFENGNVTARELVSYKNIYVLPIECPLTEKSSFASTKMGPVVIEINDQDLDSYPCLPGGKDTKAIETVDAYGYTETQTMKHRRLKIESWENSSFFTTEQYYEPGDRGGPLLRTENNTWILIGVGSTAAVMGQQNTSFHNIVYYEYMLCDRFGICPAAPIATTTPTTITPSTSTTTTTTTTTTAKATTVTLPRSITANFNSTTLPFNQSIVTFPMSSIRPSTLITETPRRRKSKNHNPPVYYDTEDGDDDDDRVEHEFDGKLFVEEDFFSGSMPTWGLFGSFIILLFLWF